MEESAKVYVHALAANSGKEPDMVPEDFIPGMTERFLATYGQPKTSVGGDSRQHVHTRERCVGCGAA